MALAPSGIKALNLSNDVKRLEREKVLLLFVLKSTSPMSVPTLCSGNRTADTSISVTSASVAFSQSINQSINQSIYGCFILTSCKS